MAILEENSEIIKAITSPEDFGMLTSFIFDAKAYSTVLNLTRQILPNIFNKPNLLVALILQSARINLESERLILDILKDHIPMIIKDAESLMSVIFDIHLFVTRSAPASASAAVFVDYAKDQIDLIAPKINSKKGINNFNSQICIHCNTTSCKDALRFITSNLPQLLQQLTVRDINYIDSQLNNYGHENFEYVKSKWMQIAENNDNLGSQNTRCNIS
jgi:hypothetical protein